MASKSAILKTLIYSDIFDYPLTKEEIWKFLIGKKPVQQKEFEEDLKRVSGAKLVHLEGGRFYCLFERERIVEKRIVRKKESQEKLVLAKKIIQRLSIIPTVLFIGVSGGLALENSSEADDIDLFVITSKNALWITRLILVLLLKLMGQYRGRGKKESQKICLNMLLDEEALMFEKDRQNLYTAHEIIQLKPVFDRNNTYNKFLFENKWVTRFLPNSIENKKLSKGVIKSKNPNYSITYPLNYFAKIIQLLYMQKHRTTEIISDHILAFHPFNYRNHILKEYNRRLKQYEV